MNRSVSVGVAILAACLVAVAQAAPKDDVLAAAKKLADSGGYAWKTTSERAGGGGGGQFVTEGKADKDGFVLVTNNFGDNSTQFAVKGAKTAVKTPDGWKTAEEAAQAGGDQPGPARWLARMAQNFKAPAAQVQDLANGAAEIKLAEGVYSGDLTEQAAKGLLTFGGRGGQNAPAISGAKGSVKFWIKDGVLSKYEYNVQGKVTFNDQEREMNRTTTVEISEVGSAKVELPDDAKKKLE